MLKVILTNLNAPIVVQFPSLNQDLQYIGNPRTVHCDGPEILYIFFANFQSEKQQIPL